MKLAQRQGLYSVPGLLALSLLLGLDSARSAAPEAPALPGPSPPHERQLPPGLEAQAAEIKQAEDGRWVFTGPVTVSWRDSKIQADRLSLSEGRHIQAEGNVLVSWGGNRIFGTRMTYDLETERGVIEEAVGQVLSEFLFWAKRVEKIGAEKVRIESATVTTCTQPVPYWSFSVSSATIRVNGYARMWNVRLRATRAPMFYLPYLVWPVKEDRAAGLLMPELHTTLNRGRVISEELFIPIGRSADITLLGRYYTKAGFGGGGEARFIPNQSGKAILNGFYIDDKVRGAGRYRAAYLQEQKFRNGFRMVSDINLVSDFDYFTDFERELDLVSTPTILARLEFARNGPWTSLNVREVRREQLFSDQSRLIQQALPEIEWRGRSRRLGRSPFYLSFESSLASIQQRRQPGIATTESDYLRGDLFPVVTLPWSPTAWLDITPRVSYRMTRYTQRQRVESDGTRTVEGNPLARGLVAYGVEIVGPKLFRIYERSESAFSSRYKHSLEPRLLYGFQDSFEDHRNEIIAYDEVDLFSGSGNQMTYSLVQRLFARRPRARPAATVQEGGETVVLPDGTTARVEGGAVAETGGSSSTTAESTEQPREALEIASLGLSQTRSFDRDISSADLDGDGLAESFSPYSDLRLNGRFNPSPAVSLDLTSNFDILFDEVKDVSLSGGLRQRLAGVRFSLVHLNGLGVDRLTSLDEFGDPVVTFVPREDRTQLRLTSDLSLLGGKLQLFVDGSFDANPMPGRPHVPDKRWRIRYGTQCCTFAVEGLSYDFVGLNDRRDLYVRVDFRGVGKILEHGF